MRVVSPIVKTLGELGSTGRSLARLREVAAILVRHGLSRLVRGVPGVEVKEPSADTATPARVAAALVELGPTYVKLGQVLSTRPDVLPADWIAAFEKLQDDVTSVPLDAIEAVLTEELGADWSVMFLEFDEEPLATASIAQVHTATLLSGEQVVLKVQRPGIAALVEADLRILRFLARRAVEEWPDLAAADPDGLLREFERTMTAELDFRREAEHMRRFRRSYSDVEWIVVPDVVDECVTERVLCMERLHGIPIRHAREAGMDMKKLGERYLEVVFSMLLAKGFFHGDLHPGNVLALPGERLGLLDFGMVGTLTDKMREQLVTMIFALQRGDQRSIARVLSEIAIKDGRLDFRALEHATGEVLERHFPPGVQLKDIEMGAFCIELISRSAGLGARVPTGYMMVLKAVVTAEGLAKTLMHEVDPIAAAAPFFAAVAAERMAPERLQQEALYAVLTLSSLLDRLPITLGQLMDDLDGQRLRMGVLRETHPTDRARADHAVTRAIVAGGGATAVLAGALVQAPPLFAGLSLATLVLWPVGGIALLLAMMGWVPRRG
jgi:ubiquinone biosynthesis protein